MSEATYANITIRKKDKPLFESLIYDLSEISFSDSYEDNIKLITYEFDNLKNGEIGIESELQAKQIPYDKYWDIYGLDPDQAEHFRINKNGKSIVKNFCISTTNMIHLEELIDAHKNNTIDNLIEKTKDKFSILSWEEQEKYLHKIR